MKRTRLLSLLLALALALSLLPGFGAADGVCVLTLDDCLVSNTLETLELPQGKTLNEAGITLPVLPDTDERRFGGWSERPTENVWESFDRDKPVTEDLTLYAVWMWKLRGVRIVVDQPVNYSSDSNDELTVSTPGWPCLYDAAGSGWWTSADAVGDGTQRYVGALENGTAYYGRILVTANGNYTFAEDAEVALSDNVTLRSKQLVETDTGEALEIVFSYVPKPAPATIGSAKLFIEQIRPETWVDSELTRL